MHWRRLYFLRTAICIMIASAAVLLLAALSNLHVLGQVEPLLLLKQQSVMLLAVAIKVVAVLLILLIRSQQIALLIVAWVSSGLIAYQVGLWFSTSEHPVSCFQIAASALFSKPLVTFWFYQGALLFLVVGSYFSLSSSSKQPSAQDRNEKKSPPMESALSPGKSSEHPPIADSSNR